MRAETKKTTVSWMSCSLKRRSGSRYSARMRIGRASSLLRKVGSRYAFRCLLISRLSMHTAKVHNESVPRTRHGPRRWAEVAAARIHHRHCDRRAAHEGARGLLRSEGARGLVAGEAFGMRAAAARQLCDRVGTDRVAGPAPPV